MPKKIKLNLNSIKVETFLTTRNALGGGNIRTWKCDTLADGDCYTLAVGTSPICWLQENDNR